LPPVIEVIEVSSDRVEVGDEVRLHATVIDQETPEDQLRFEWKAESGTFTGEGASVRWRAPSDVKTPADVTIELTVVELYGPVDTTGKQSENATTDKAPPIRVHNSQKEVGDLSLQFLSDFANSSLSAGVCLRNFSDTCPGKIEERDDIEDNRARYDILASSLSVRNVTANLSTGTAKSTIACSFTSRTKKCDIDDDLCIIGDVATGRGDCLLTAIYEKKGWWLCDSHYIGRLPASMRGFFSRVLSRP
jgi:hypothetical protein